MEDLIRSRLNNAHTKSLLGADNWHFLVGDKNKELEQHLGKRVIADSALALWESDHNRRVEYCVKHNISFHTFVVPDRIQSLKCYLPSAVIEAGVLDGLSTNGSKVSRRIDGHYSELLGHFSASKAKLGQLYCKTDTHWSDLGALHFANFLHELDPVLFSRHDIGSYLFAETKLTGDICKNDPMPFSESIISLKSRLAAISKSLHPHSGRLTLAKNTLGAGRKLLIFGNSYITDALLHYLSKDFHEITYAFSNSFDYNLVSAVAPDAIIYQTLERFTILPPNDTVHMTAFERASYLCATGRRAATSHRLHNHPYNTLSEICLKVAAGIGLAINDYKFLEHAGLQLLYRYCVVIIYYLSGHKSLALQLVVDELKNHGASSNLVKYAQLLNAHKDASELSLLFSKRKAILES